MGRIRECDWLIMMCQLHVGWIIFGIGTFVKIIRMCSIMEAVKCVSLELISLFLRVCNVLSFLKDSFMWLL